MQKIVSKFSFRSGLFLTKVYENFNKLTAFDCNFDSV